MAFDSTAYRKTVLEPLAKDNARLEALRQVIREVQGSSGLAAAAQLDMAELYVIDPSMTARELASHLKSVGMLYNKQQRLPSAQLLKKLLGLLDKPEGKVTDPAFWAGLAARHKKALAQQLDTFAQAMAKEQPLGVVTTEQVREQAAGAGLAALPDRDLAAALARRGVEVRPDFAIPKVPIPSAVRKVTEYPEFRTVVDVVLRPTVPADVAVIDELSWGDPPRKLTPDAVVRAQKTLEEQEARVEANARQAAQYALAALKDGCRTPAALHELMLASIAELTEGLIRRRMPQVSVRDELIRRGLRELDAARLVAKLLASTQVLTLGDVAERLADGALADARRLFDALPVVEGDDEAERALEARITAAERRKHDFVRRYEQALGARDYQAAGAALRDALVIDREDEDLARLLTRLPPLPPSRVSLRVDGRALEITWSADPDQAVRYTVLRTEGTVPANDTDGEVLARNLEVARYRDPAPPVGRHLRFSVFATRDGASHSDPVGATAVVLPAPADLRASPGTTDVSLSWSIPPESVGVVVTQTAPDGARRVHPPTGAGRLSVRGLVTGTRYRFAAKAIYLLSDGERRESDSVVVDATPRGSIRPVDDLRVENRLAGEPPGHRAIWTIVAGYPVELWALPITARPVPGSRVSLEDLTGLGGQRLVGRTREEERGGSIVHEFDPLPDVRVLVPITIDGDGGLVGAPRVAGSAPPVREPKAERLDTDLRISWVWPQGDYLVEVAWMAHGDRNTRRVSRATYNDGGGVRIAGADAVRDVTLATVTRAGEQEWVSPAVRVPLPLLGAAARVGYTLKVRRPRFGGRLGGCATATLVAESAGFRGTVPVVIVVREAKFMPAKPSDGRVVDRPVLDFATGEPVTIELDLGRVSPPFWVRMFLGTQGAVRLDDPPTSQMRG